MTFILSQFLYNKYPIPIKAAIPAITNPIGLADIAIFNAHCPAAASFVATLKANIMLLSCVNGYINANNAYDAIVITEAIATNAPTPTTKLDVNLGLACAKAIIVLAPCLNVSIALFTYGKS